MYLQITFKSGIQGEDGEDTSSDHSSTTSGSSSPSSSRSERSLSHRPVVGSSDLDRASELGSGVRNRPRLQSNASTIVAPHVGGFEPDDPQNTSKDHIINGTDGLGDPSEFLDFEQRRRMRQLRLKRKFYEFYAAPITKFWSWSISYFLFLIIYTYTMLIRTPETPEWNE